MLTRTGWIAVLAAMGLLATGRLLGMFELYVLGAGVGALVIGALLWVNASRLRIDVSRRLHPPRVYAGTASRVEVHVHNRGRRTPPLTLRDPVGTGRHAEVSVGPLAPGQRVGATYRLPTERRGIVPVGPLSVEVGDPFGLACLSTDASERTELTVYPPVERVAPLPHTMGDDPHAGADHPNTLSSTGEDFYALRHYEVGDDLRRVHWRATARHDDLMVRQEEMPWQGRATVVLDVRTAAHTDASFDQAVSAAASIVLACQQRRFLLRLVTSDGRDSGFAAGQAHIEKIMEGLATVQPSGAARLQGVLETLRRTAHGGALVALLGGRAAASPSGGGIEAVARAAGTLPHATTVVFGDVGALGTNVLVVSPGDRFGDVWNAAMSPSRPAGMTARNGR